jgi:hypothetical protein
MATAPFSNASGDSIFFICRASNLNAAGEQQRGALLAMAHLRNRQYQLIGKTAVSYAESVPNCWKRHRQ